MVKRWGMTYGIDKVEISIRTKYYNDIMQSDYMSKKIIVGWFLLICTMIFILNSNIINFSFMRKWEFCSNL